MKKVELLAPAGNMECLYQAVHHGADAVYLGGMKFGARKFANNFNDEEIVEAIRYCHLYGVKVYVTVNILVYDSEIEELLSYVRFLHQNGVDAVIVQDLGVLSLLRKKFPNLVLHASTQMHNHNKYGISMLKDLGVTRVVLARELSLEQIKTLDVSIEKEVFVHGALCICYSGCCLMSQRIGGRSGNRGECAGSCRLPYELYRDGTKVEMKGKYLLSPKDLNVLSEVGLLIEAGITSFKIEGRMKSPTYVAVVTDFYRKAIDAYYEGREYQLSKEEEIELRQPFYRGYTKGHLFGDALMNIKKPNHMGVPLGTVLETHPRVKVKLTSSLVQQDGIQFSNGTGMIINRMFDEKGRLIKEVSCGDSVFFETKVLVSKGEVVKTLDVKQVKSYEHIIEKKIPVSFSVLAEVGKPFTLTIFDGIHQITKISSLVEVAKTSPFSKEQLEKQLRKLGNTPFIVTDITMKIDSSIFLSIQEINSLRRDVCEELKMVREEEKTAFLECDYSLEIDDVPQTSEITVVVRDNETLQKALLYPCQIATSDYELYQKNLQNRLWFLTNRIGEEKNYEARCVIANELGAIGQYSSSYVASAPTINVTNAYTVRYLESLGVKKIALSTELTLQQIKELVIHYQTLFHQLPNLEVFLFGRIELMIMEHCLISEVKHCNLCKNHVFSLKDQKGCFYPILTDCDCRNHIYDKMVQNNIAWLESLQSLGITNYRLDVWNVHDFEEQNVEKVFSL